MDSRNDKEKRVPKTNPLWPVLTSYDQKHLTRIALPLGGIGTGTVSLGGRGDLRDWEILNRPAKGFQPDKTFFALYVKSGQAPAVVRALEGVIEPGQYEGASGSTVPNHNLPRFRKCNFAAAYPLGQVLLSDPDVPVDVRIEGFNPLVPGDVDSSSIPMAILRFVLINKTSAPLTASVCGTLANFIGTDGEAGKSIGNVNVFRTGKGVRGLFMRSEGVAPAAEQWGTLALAAVGDVAVTHRTGWAKLSWFDTLRDFWDDLSEDGKLENRLDEGVDTPHGSLAVSLRIPPRGQKSATFLLAWHFPNRMTWTPLKDAETCSLPASCGDGCCGQKSKADPNRVGNYYATKYTDAWDVVAKTAPSLKQLEARTVKFLTAFCAADLPKVVKEAALYNVSTLRTQTCFRTEDGRFFGWEGCMDKTGCCWGSCTHVWNYEQTTPYWFIDLACSMREVEFGHESESNGLMSFRANLPLAGPRWKHAAADGQMGTIMRFYRDWQVSGDNDMFRRLWPNVRKALEFAWIPGGWDADKDGVMEGCQHNTMDVEYYGPNPQMGALYLGALRACQEMARFAGEHDFAATCGQLFEKGKTWIDANLFNGQYYEHQIRTVKDPYDVAPGLQVSLATDVCDPSGPILQLGAGCLVDQLVGQMISHVAGLGHLLDPAHIRTTLVSILKYNFRPNMYGHFNHLRSFVLNEEAGLLMASYPLGRRPKRPFPYWNEVMTGFEYTAAINMLQEGMVAQGLKCIATIRARYDGAKRSPFDEAECGHHYARAMAAWGAVLALTGFRYSGVDKTMTFAPAKGAKTITWFWSNGAAYGTVTQRNVKGRVEVALQVLHGTLALRRLVLAGVGEARTRTGSIPAGGTAKFVIDK